MLDASTVPPMALPSSWNASLGRYSQAASVIPAQDEKHREQYEEGFFHQGVLARAKKRTSFARVRRSVRQASRAVLPVV